MSKFNSLYESLLNGLAKGKTLEDLAKKHKVDLSDNKKAIRRIKTVSERAKRTLSSSVQTTIELDSIYDGIDLNISLSRAKLESLCSDIFNKILNFVFINLVVLSFDDAI